MAWPCNVKSESQYFQVVNLEKYQHYKHRNPPWVKLHAITLEDYDFGRLQDASKMHLCAIWLLASRTDNRIPWDAEWIATRINATAEVDLDALQDAGFIELIADASKALATRKQSAASETETETEQNREQSPTSLVGRSEKKRANNSLPPQSCPNSRTLLIRPTDRQNQATEQPSETLGSYRTSCSAQQAAPRTMRLRSHGSEQPTPQRASNVSSRYSNSSYASTSLRATHGSKRYLKINLASPQQKLSTNASTSLSATGRPSASQTPSKEQRPAKRVSKQPGKQVFQS